MGYGGKGILKMIQMTAQNLKSYSKKNIDELTGLVKPILSYREKLYERYTRKSNPTEIMGVSSSKYGSHNFTIAFEYYIVNMVQGYLGGKAPMYSIMKNLENEEKNSNENWTSYAEEYKAAIERIRRYNDDAATFIELIHDYLITASAYLYIFEDEDNEIRYVRFDSRQTVSIYDYSTPPAQIGLVRVWDENGTSAVEIITDSEKIIYRNDENEIPEKLDWGDVPGIAFENPDNIAIFEPAIPLIDTYEQLVQNVRNMTQYNDDAKLLISGFRPDEPLTITDEKTGAEIVNPKRKALDEAWLNAVTLFIGEGGSVSWLLKNVDYSGTLSQEKSLHDLITMLTGVPNMTDEAFSNADNASALGYKLYALDQYSATADRVFRKGYLRLWEIITNRLNEKRSLKGKSNFDFRTIDIVMQRNLPTDKDKSISRAAQMKQSNLFSDETCINESQIEVDAKEEIERRKQEEQAVYEEIKIRNAESPFKEEEFKQDEKLEI